MRRYLERSGRESLPPNTTLNPGAANAALPSFAMCVGQAPEAFDFGDPNGYSLRQGKKTGHDEAAKPHHCTWQAKSSTSDG